MSNELTQGQVVAVNLRDPGMAAVGQETSQMPTSSSPSGESGASGGKELDLEWQRVLGEDKSSRLILFPEQTPAPEVKVSQEAVLIAKYALTRAVDGYRRLKNDSSNSSNSLVGEDGSLRKVVEAIFGGDIPKDISDDKIREQIESFFQKYPEQATFLGVYWVQEEWRMMREVYQIDKKPQETSKDKKDKKKAQSLPSLDEIKLYISTEPKLVYGKNPDGSTEIHVLPAFDFKKFNPNDPRSLDILYEIYSRWFDETHGLIPKKPSEIGFWEKVFGKKLTKEELKAKLIALYNEEETGDLSISLRKNSDDSKKSYLDAVYGKIIENDQPVLEGYERFSFLASYVERLRKELLPVVGGQRKRFLEVDILDKDFSLIETGNINDKINDLITKIKDETKRSLNLERSRETGKGVSGVIESRLEEERQKQGDLKRFEEIKTLLNEVRIGQNALEILAGQIEIPEELRTLIITIRPDLKDDEGNINELKLRKIVLALLTGSEKDIFIEAQSDKIAQYERASSQIEQIERAMNEAYNKWVTLSSIEITQTQTGEIHTKKHDEQVIKEAREIYENLKKRYDGLKQILDSEEIKNLVSMRDRLRRLIQGLRESEQVTAYITQYTELREKRKSLLIEAARAEIVVTKKDDGSVDVDQTLTSLGSTDPEENIQRLEAMQIVFRNWSERITQIANRIENPPKKYDKNVWQGYNEDALRVIYVIFGEEYLIPTASGTPEEKKARLAEIGKIKKLIEGEDGKFKIGGVEIDEDTAKNFSKIMSIIDNWLEELGIESFS
jgi:hypothetical protein